MKKSHATRLQDLLGLLNSNYPQHLAEEWDNVGLQTGDLTQEISKIMVALEPTLSTVNRAISTNCQLLITHHPLIFKPLKKITPSDNTGKILFHAIRNNLAIISIHTNLDHAADGLNDWLAATLHLHNCKPLLQPKSGELLKLVIYVPRVDADKVANAIFKAGAGKVGNYDHCSFSSIGVGTFRAGEGCNPHIGSIGTDEQVEEVRLETIVTRSRLKRVLEQMEKQHPYEEVAFDLIHIENVPGDVGLGRIGVVETKQSLKQFAAVCKQALNCPALRVVGNEDNSITKVAVCSGSGAMLIHEAARKGADVLVTGDIKYHEALTAKELGLTLVDAGHFATEHIMASRLAEKLTIQSQKRGWELEYITAPNEIDPFTII
ncbi:MAG: Nif3-like dinuclear metal center hexameric protein [Desulfobacteraceae bacterium 4572_35.1]|nr:MAG: Nif3-like dinuclear metal center hexameric protein [Desulfobacteraceae bacterium 4572_35.1]